jgi:hypothetical protein
LDWKAISIAAAAERIKAKSFTIDGEAVVLGPDGLSRFDELRRREAMRTAILYAFDLIERDGEDLRNRPFLDRKDALARLLLGTEMGILLNEQIADDGPTVFAHACRLGAEGIVSKRVDGTYRSKQRLPPTRTCSHRSQNRLRRMSLQRRWSRPLSLVTGGTTNVTSSRLSNGSFIADARDG